MSLCVPGPPELEKTTFYSKLFCEIAFYYRNPFLLRYCSGFHRMLWSMNNESLKYNNSLFWSALTLFLNSRITFKSEIFNSSHVLNVLHITFHYIFFKLCLKNHLKGFWIILRPRKVFRQYVF